MKLKIVSLAAAAALSVSVAGAASSANAAGMGAGLNAGPVINKTVQDTNLKQATYYGYGYGYHARRCARLRYLARMGSRWARIMYLRHCRYGHRPRFCKRLYVKGFIYGNPRARYLYRKYCRFHRVGFSIRFGF